jgi:hypothetical protein
MDIWWRAFWILIVGGLARTFMFAAAALFAAALFMAYRDDKKQTDSRKRKLPIVATVGGIVCGSLFAAAFFIPHVQYEEGEKLHEALVTPLVDKLNELNDATAKR